MYYLYQLNKFKICFQSESYKIITKSKQSRKVFFSPVKFTKVHIRRFVNEPTKYLRERLGPMRSSVGLVVASQSVRLHMEKIHEKLFYIWTSGSERRRLKKKFMDYGQRPITIAHHEPFAQAS